MVHHCSCKGPETCHGLMAVTKIVHGHTVKVPVMVNLKDTDPPVELTWDRGACKSFLASRAVVTASTFQAGAKRREMR